MRALAHSLLLALALAGSAHATPDAAQPARLILVASPGEAFTPAQAAEARAEVAAALAWWDAASLAAGLPPPRLALVEERAITVPDPFADGPWMAPLVTWDSPTLEVYVVANHTHRGLLLREYAGQAAPGYRAVFAVARSAQGLAATIEFLRGNLDQYKVGQYIL